MSEPLSEAGAPSGPAGGPERWRGPFLAAGALLGGLAVAAGAFGAHGLRGLLDEHALAIYRTGAHYHLAHAVALIAVAAAPRGLWRRRACAAACSAWIAGIVLFSGSLYLLAVTGARWLGLLTPAGGLAFVLGWGLLALAAPGLGRDRPDR